MKFAVGQAVRYKPGFGTYGYEDSLEADGRVPAIVVGHTKTRIRINVRCDKGAVTRAVDAASLTVAPAEPRHVV